MRAIFSIWRNIVIIQVRGKINKFSFLPCCSRNGKCKYMTNGTITKLFFVLMNSFFFIWGAFLSICLSQTVECVDLKGDVVLLNTFTISVNILIITSENKCTSGARLLSYFLLIQFKKFTCLYLI